MAACDVAVHDVGMDCIPIGEQPEQPDNVVHLPTADGLTEPADEEMSYEDAIAADADRVDDASEQTQPGSHIAGMLEQGVRVGAGLFAAGASALADALRTTITPDETAEDRPDPAATLAGAGLGVAVTAAEAAADAATKMSEAFGPAISWLVEPRFAKDAGEMAGGVVRVLDGRWKASQAELVDAATSFLGALVPEITKGLAEQVDLTTLVREQIDVDAILADVDIDRILERVDVDAIVSRVDMERVARTFPVEAVVERVDVNRAADRLDVDRIAARTDLQAIVERLDLAAIAEEVIDEIDLPQLVRESTGIMANETIQTVRVQGMNADRVVSRVVDTVLRRQARDLVPPGPADGSLS